MAAPAAPLFKRWDHVGSMECIEDQYGSMEYLGISWNILELGISWNMGEEDNIDGHQ